jgi:hypothetical protein
MPQTKAINSPIEEEVERWEHETLEPALSEHPETKKRFETVSLEEVKGSTFHATFLFPAHFLTHVEFILQAIAENFGPCGSLRASAPPKKLTHDSNTY